MGETTSERAERLKGSVAEAIEAVPAGEDGMPGLVAAAAIRELVGGTYSESVLPDELLWDGVPRSVRRWFAIGLRAGYAFGLGSGEWDGAERLRRADSIELELRRHLLRVEGERDEAREQLAQARRLWDEEVESIRRRLVETATERDGLRGSLDLARQVDEARRIELANIRAQRDAGSPVVQAARALVAARADGDFALEGSEDAWSTLEEAVVELDEKVRVAEAERQAQLERFSERIRGELKAQLAQPNPFLSATDRWGQTPDDPAEPADEPYVEPVESQAWRALYTTAGAALEARLPILVAALRAVDTWDANDQRPSGEAKDAWEALRAAVHAWRQTPDAEIFEMPPFGQPGTWAKLAADLPPSETTLAGEDALAHGTWIDGETPRIDAKLSGLTLVDTFEPNVAGPPPYAWKGGLVSSDPQLQVVTGSPIVEPEPPYRLSHDARFPVLPIFSDEQIERARWLAAVPAWQRSIERWCRLVSHVNSVLFGMEYPSDCVCGLLPNDWSWRRSEHLERIVEQLVLDAIAAIDRHGDQMARNVIGGVRYGDIEGLGAVHRAAYDAAHAAVRASELDGLAERVKERTDYVGDRKGHNLVVAEDGDA